MKSYGIAQTCAMNESNNIDAIQYKLDGAIQYIKSFEHRDISKQQLERDLEALERFKKALSEFLFGVM